MQHWTIRRATDHDASGARSVLHAAHTWNLANGFNFTGGYITEEDLRQRIAESRFFVAERDGRVVGTVSVAPEALGRVPHAVERVPEVQPGDWVLHMLGVDPALGKSGVGRAMVECGEAQARREGGLRMVLDTPEGHPWLPAYYLALGYRTIGHIQWEGKQYRSLLFAKELAAKPIAS